MAKVDEPKFTVETSDGPCEVRRYQARIIAETHVSGDRTQAANEGFRRRYSKDYEHLLKTYKID